ncbi:site-specific integrase [Pseudomonas sp. F01002]|uniref:site-specific integrase n=1 Tax=Pseudomonas sp. F01002 TaxID=2555724 RepID=UPI00106AE09B|nr:site-specific integrase [Pseudomonas sp. F01002]TFB32436.1 site-specific integrase [Pseudomonas sp. F01002]
MNASTEESYRKLAAHFYKTRLQGEQPTPKRIADSLKAAAGDYRPAYWRKLRNALAFDQRERGFAEAAKRIDATKNPLTKDGATEGIKPKQARSRRVDQADEDRLMQHFSKLDDRATTAALFVSKYTGARPAELKNIEIRGDLVFIHGAKKSHGGARGADRELVLPPKVVEMIGKALPYLKDDIGPIQDRIRAAGKKLWPQRKSVPSLYSWRHQLGSELKASGIDRREVAYLMGHQATESVDRYGNSRTAKGNGKGLPKVPPDADLSSIRVDHSEPPTANGRSIGIDAAQENISDFENGGKSLKLLTSATEKSQKGQRVVDWGELKPGG